jgi:hypothetical protein
MHNSFFSNARVQLIYLQRHPKQYIHAIYGPPDTLLYPGVDKLVVSFDLSPSSSSSPSTALPSSSANSNNSNAAPSFTFLSKRGILGELGLSEDQFLDVAILVGGVGGEKGAQGQTGAFPPTMHEQALKVRVFFCLSV